MSIVTRMLSTGRRVRMLAADPDARAYLRFLATKPSAWRAARPDFTSRRPPYLGEASVPPAVSMANVKPLLVWGAQRLRDDAFDLRLAGTILRRTPHPKWETRFRDLEDEASLHRFAWLLPWLIDRQREGTESYSVWSIVDSWQRSWLARHPHPDSTEAWQTYTASERIVNWIMAALALGHRAAEGLRKSALEQHAEHILTNLEYYGERHTGNHLSNNGRALYIAGVVLGRGDFREIGRRILLEERRRLFECAGFLREDSSHYQFLIARNYTEVLWFAFQARDVEFAKALRDTVRELADACMFFLVQNGETIAIPTIGDISPDCSLQWLLGVPWVAASLSGTASPDGEPPRGTWSDLFLDSIGSGGRVSRPREGVVIEREWMRLDRNGWTVFSHVNRLGVPFQPGHAHNDTGGVVAYFEGAPVLTEAGRRTYAVGEVGRFGTEGWAHSLLIVDGRSAAPWAHSMVIDDYLRSRAGSRPSIEASGTSIVIRHGGFSRIPGVGEHRRYIRVNDEGDLEIIDHLDGSGVHKISLMYHLNEASMLPNARELQIGAYGSLRLPHDLREVRIVSAPEGCETLGWGTPRYGDKMPICSVVAEGRRPLPWRGNSVVRMSCRA